MVIDVLKEACRLVYIRTKKLAGTAAARRQMGRGAGGDMSRRIDVVAEQAVLEVVKRRHLDPTIIGEECGRIEGTQGYLVMDAIDGTTNAVRGLPFHCCSVAYAPDFRLSAVTDAAVIDLGSANIYYASSGKGAYLNKRKIVAKKESDDPIIGINMSGLNSEIVERLKPIVSEADHVRQLGANALEMCYLARGLLDAYIDLRGKIRPTDIAAAYLIGKEAGCIICSSKGSQLESDLDVKTRLSYVAAANNDMLKQIGRHLF